MYCFVLDASAMASGEPDDMRPDERQARSPADYDAPDFLTVVYQRVFQLLDWRWPSEKGSDPEVSPGGGYDEVA